MPVQAVYLGSVHGVYFLSFLTCGVCVLFFFKTSLSQSLENMVLTSFFWCLSVIEISVAFHYSAILDCTHSEY